MVDRVARGRLQQEWLDAMLSLDGLYNPMRELRGRARAYIGRYRASFVALQARMRQAGYEITRTPGPRGGEWSAHYTARLKGEQNG